VFVVDTNIFLYAAEKSCPEHHACRKLLESWRVQASAWYTTWGIVYEFLRVITHPKVFEKPWTSARAWQFVEAVIASPSFGILVETPRHQSVATQTLQEIPQLHGNILHDAHTAIVMREHGIQTIYSRDTHFNRFPFVEVRDPLA
jgi:toxin-antitoxin system PIN domain toxin